MAITERQLYKPTPAEIAEFLQLAKKRNKSFKTHDPFVQRDPLKAGIVDVLGNWFFKESRLIGEENLLAGEEMAKGIPHTYTPIHKCDGDHEALEKTLTVNGHEVIAKKLGFIAGWKMVDRWYLDMLMGAQTAFLSVPPADLKTVLLMKNQMKTDEEKTIWKEHRAHIRRISNKTKVDVQKWEEEGNSTVVYVEGKRLRYPFVIGSPPEEMEKFFDSERIITPVYSKGVEKLIPVNKIINPFKRGTIQFEFGKPYHTDDMKNLLEDKISKDAGITIVDIALARILKLAPFLPHPVKMGDEFRNKYELIEQRDPYMQKKAA